MIKLLFYLVSFLIFAVFVGPYLYISQYIFLSQDDFCRVFPPGNNYFEAVKFWYLNENGRYINAFLSLLPVYDLKVYRLIPILMISSLLICTGYFFKNLCSFFRLQIPGYIVILSCVLIVIQIFIKLPVIFEFIYWYAGVTVYFVSILLILLFLNSLLILDFSKKKNLIAISLIIILLNGNNEMALFFVNFVLFIILIYAAKTKTKFLRPFFALNVVSWISSIPLLFAASSDARRSHFEDGGDFIFSMISSFLSAASFFVKNTLNFPDILFWLGLTFLIIGTGQKIKNYRKRSVFINPLFLLTMTYGALMSQMFVIYYASGFLEAYGSRIGNFIHVIFIFLMLINLVNLTGYVLHRRPPFKENLKLYLSGSLLLLGIFLCYNVFEGKNYKQVITDLTTGKAQNYRENIEERLSFLKGTNESHVEFKTIPLPKTITNFDLRTVPYWENDCFQNMINNRYKKSIKSIIRLE